MSAKKKKPTRGGRREGAGRKPAGKGRYLVTLNAENAENAKARTENFSGLLDSLLAQWLKKAPPQLPVEAGPGDK
ncbi:MAG TPA: type II toxin-antitoxin system CcdA family antitoxin [Verrucomicrobiales bacterium]|jgi:hypothetical protein|nr:type II toxin-antitoxin system CcdA family antitoxin [Verrucomicrobiales bacterium]